MAVRQPDLVGGRQAWRLLQGDTKAAAYRRRQADRYFARLHPEGHAESIRFIAQAGAKNPEHPLITSDKTFLELIHPAAFRLIARYGVDYVPVLMEHAFANPLQPIIGRCFWNATLLSLSWNEHRREEGTMLYVEGIAAGVHVPPMLHAWNALGETKEALDWSYYASAPWTRYIGVPFTPEEHEEIREAAGVEAPVLSMFGRTNFQKVRPHVQRVLKRRNTKSPPP